MRRTDRRLSDQECRDILLEIVRMVIDTYAKPIRKGFGARMSQAGYDLIAILRNHSVICPGEPNQQERMEL